MTAVVDASVGAKWFFNEPETEKAEGLLHAEDLVVPRLFLVEVANLIWKRHRRSEISQADAERSLELLVNGLPLRVADEKGLIGAAFQIAQDLDHPVYDCLYLALAESLNCRLVTSDARLSRRLDGTSWQGMVELY
jgi:predicted nucleic acid-binding protein